MGNPETSPSQNPEKPKIPEGEFREKVNAILGDITIGQMLLAVSLKTNNEGNIEEFMIENLKRMAKVGARMAPDSIVKDKLSRLLIYLETGVDPGPLERRN